MEITVKQFKEILEQFDDDALVSIQALMWDGNEAEKVDVEVENFLYADRFTDRKGNKWAVILGDGHENYPVDDNTIIIDKNV